jgi:hypothetical protein
MQVIFHKQKVYKIVNALIGISQENYLFSRHTAFRYIPVLYILGK